MTARRVVGDPGDWAALRRAFRWNIPDDFNMAEACCDSWARAEPERVAFTHVGENARDWTYGALRDASDRLAGVFAKAGLGRGDRVGVLLGQSPETLIAHLATWKRAAISIPLFSLFGPDALAFRLADSGAKLVVTDAAGAEKLAAIRGDLPDLEAVFVVDGGDGRDFWAEIEAAPPAPPEPVGAEDPAVIIYTSGTTGPPKGALHAHRFLIGHLPSIELHHEGFPQPGDVGWTPADWAWIGGLMDIAMPCLYHGVRLVSCRMRKFDPAEAYRLIAEQKVRNLFLPPTALKLMRQAEIPETVSIRTIGSGGEALGADLLDWAKRAFGVTINEFYGQTECNLVLASCAGSMEVRPGSMGQAVPGHEVAVIDGAGQEVAPGTTGEIAVKRPDPVMFLGYWNLPEKTAEKFTGDWMRTGDLGVMDEDGYFTYVSRDDDVISSAGYRIGPTEIETCLTGHPDVVMAAAVGVPDETRGEVVKAFVVLRSGVAPDGLEAALIQRVRDKVSPHVAPRSVAFVEELPMTATGKIMRRSLRDPGAR
ncbi:AMP-binding protein [Maritimibacter sp. UBA3975]|uniref:AMP-binding protein n=1 Tax=Maritimibacter sp. UBA3975 TaxID=1946833 RepID=UPI000C094CE3|nr:AMP-binding protein [Maritimibacter sp. UBA3975]MAM60981.1 AMP-dependent synthetase [Maritimibacter sp.]|tara:strand:+ start:31384 stop:32994 length:1611 start_codon:yes stop_codon:yes gene_type:complete